MSTDVNILGSIREDAAIMKQDNVLQKKKYLENNKVPLEIRNFDNRS